LRPLIHFPLRGSRGGFLLLLLLVQVSAEKVVALDSADPRGVCDDNFKRKKRSRRGRRGGRSRERKSRRKERRKRKKRSAPSLRSPSLPKKKETKKGGKSYFLRQPPSFLRRLGIVKMKTHHRHASVGKVAVAAAVLLVLSSSILGSASTALPSSAPASASSASASTSSASFVSAPSSPSTQLQSSSPDADGALRTGGGKPHRKRKPTPTPPPPPPSPQTTEPPPSDGGYGGENLADALSLSLSSSFDVPSVPSGVEEREKQTERALCFLLKL